MPQDKNNLLDTQTLDLNELAENLGLSLEEMKEVEQLANIEMQKLFNKIIENIGNYLLTSEETPVSEDADLSQPVSLLAAASKYLERFKG